MDFVFNTGIQSDRVMLLSIFVDKTLLENNTALADALKEIYTQKADEHNKRIQSNPFYDAGFDLFNPLAITISDPTQMVTVGYGIRTSAKQSILQRPCNCCRTNENDESVHSCWKPTAFPSPFQLCPRSSITKTPLHMANSHGIIDSGYRGELIAKFDVVRGSIPVEPFVVLDQYTRLTQIVAPNMCPIVVKIVECVDDLDDSSSSTMLLRGDGGFGSTGSGI